MDTTIKINSLSDFNTDLFTQLVKDIVIACGSVEITIKPQVKYKAELIERVNKVNEGAVLYSFTDAEFNDLSNKILKGEEISKDTFNKVRKDEKGNFIPA